MNHEDLLPCYGLFYKPHNTRRSSPMQGPNRHNVLAMYT